MGADGSVASHGISRETESHAQSFVPGARAHETQVQTVTTRKWEKPPCCPSQAVEETITPLEQGVLHSGENQLNIHHASVELWLFGENVMELNLSVDGLELNLRVDGFEQRFVSCPFPEMRCPCRWQ